MKKKPYYIILTGSKNNAGDFLIKYRAKEIFKNERPDREIIDINGWEKFTPDILELVNSAEALILMGGPALQKHMYPNVYPLVDDLSSITTKIVMMGVGWKSLSGNWIDSVNYQLGSKCESLIQRIKNDGLTSSVRDYHTKNVLNHHGLDNVLMTGCPATYVEEYFDTIVEEGTLKKISFSLGVSFINSEKMLTQMKTTISELEIYCEKNNIELEVVFHHGTNKKFLTTHGSFEKHLNEHQKFINWLDTNALKWVDISGSAEKLINYYSSTCLHIGYRVHAHIFMNSISKPSILIAEDGRGKALRRVFGGVVIDAFSEVKSDSLSKVIRKLGFDYGFIGTEHVPHEVIDSLKYQGPSNLAQIKTVRGNINENYKVMKKFISLLP